jgi:hypothetical protein
MRPKTIFCDIDGTLIEHMTPPEAASGRKGILLQGTTEKLSEWDRKGYRIILTTGRKESIRKPTEKMLARLGIFYDMLIMGIGGGDRILINDLKADSDRETAYAICIERNKGISKVEI